jgi:hypothetical protein
MLLAFQGSSGMANVGQVSDRCRAEDSFVYRELGLTAFSVFTNFKQIGVNFIVFHPFGYTEVEL